jgi:hypothetical protein
MKFIQCRRVPAPPLSEDEAERLYDWKLVESPVPLSEGDCFCICCRGTILPVFCSSSAGRYALRRMSPEEIQYSAENRGDSPWL